ncbi:hypothetical protein NJ76_25655 [Rhodococcus sp. IITR03]|nr:hypothetical protein NJ76_25655 [Rhodococcus sp. IITR03]
MGKQLDSYRSNWARIGAADATVLGGVSVLAFEQKRPASVRAPTVITGGDRINSAGVRALFFPAVVVMPNALYADRNSPYHLSEKQLGRPEMRASKSTSRKRRR